MAITYIERLLGTLSNPSANSNVQTFQLPREHLYSRLWLKATFPTSTTNNYVAGGERLAVTRLEVIANGQLVVKSYSWDDLQEMNLYQNKVDSVYTAALTAAKTAGYSSVIIDFSLTKTDLATMLPSFMFTSLDLKVTWAAQTAYGGDSGILPTCDIWSREALFTKEFRDMVFAFNKETTMQSFPTATGMNEINMTIANIYRRIFVRANGGAATGASDTVVTDVEVVQDGVIYHRKTTWIGDIVINKQEYQLNTRPVGDNMIDFDITGDAAATVDSAPFSSWKLRCNVASVANTVTLTVIPQEIVVQRK
jgi:hypothetical protein